MAKLSINELKIGMEVRASQLSEIYNTYIILTNAEQLPDGDTVGTISFINNILNEESDRLFVKGARLCPIYREREYYEGDVVYDE